MKKLFVAFSLLALLFTAAETKLEAKKVSVSLLTYNIWALPYQDLGAFSQEVAKILGINPDDFDISILDTHADERVQKMIPQLAAIEVDFFVFQEAFDSPARKKLKNGLIDHEIPYKTSVLGRSIFFSERLTNSGLFTMSRIPIEKTDGIYYQDTFQTHHGIECFDSDCLADKGVLYTKVIKDDLPIHIFSTHTQAKTHKADEIPPLGSLLRHAQYQRIKEFIDSKQIPQTEPVLIVGDMNVDKANPKTRLEEYNEYLAMKEILHAEEADPLDSEPSTHFNKENKVKYESEGARIDYVLYSKNHLKPTNSSSFVYNSIQDSDHMPVLGHFEFDL